MSICIIGLGKWSTSYINILLAAIFKCLRDCLLNFNSIAPESKLGLFGFEPILSNHTIITNIYIYISYILFGSIFFYISYKKSTGEKKQNQKTVNNEKERWSLLLYKKNIINIKKILHIILVSLIYAFHSDIIKISYLFGFSDFDIWTFDLIFILFFMNKYFVVNIYNHRKISICFICIISTLFIFVSMFFSSDKDKNNSFQAIYNLVNNGILCFLIFMAFLLISFITAFGRVLTKVLMDLKFISPYIFIICTGIIGFIFNSIILADASNHECSDSKILNNSCLVESENKKYFDNINIYFSNLNEYLKGVQPEGGYTPKIKFFVEILVIVPLFLVFSYFEFYFEIKTINVLSPSYILIRDNLYYGLSRIVSFCINSNRNIVQFILLEFAEIAAILGYSVYLEIIELRFCGLDRKLKRKLTETANLESQVYMINVEEKEDSDDEEDYEDNNGNIPSSNL